MAEKMSLNQKIEKLDAEVEWFYSDEFKLEDAVAKYKEAVKLASPPRSARAVRGNGAGLATGGSGDLEGLFAGLPVAGARTRRPWTTRRPEW